MLTIKYTDPSWNDEIIQDLDGAVKITRKSGNATIEDASPAVPTTLPAGVVY